MCARRQLQAHLRRGRPTYGSGVRYCQVLSVGKATHFRWPFSLVSSWDTTAWVRFELTRTSPSAVFKTAAFNHSATTPDA